MNTANKARALNIAIGVALVAGLVFLVMKTRSVDFDTHAEVINTLRQLKQVDAEWNVDVLKSKTGFNSNYDPVASPLPLIESLQRALANSSDQLWTLKETDQETLKPLLDQYSKSMNEKIGLIERFKSQNSILRNSSRFLPVAASEFAESARATDPQLRAQLDSTLNAILADTMTYNLAPDANLRTQIEANAKALLDRSASLPTELNERAEVFSAHVNTILRQQAIGDEVLSTITALPTAKHIDALTDGYQREHDKLLHDQQRYRQILIAYSVLLLALLAFLGWRLLRSYRLLNKTNQSLEKANHDLKESQVYMVQTEKMSALGQMVAGIAHEINTPLAYVKGTLDVLRHQIAPVQNMSKGISEFAQMARDPKHDRQQLNVKFAQVSALSKEVEEHRIMDEMGGLLKDGLHGIDQISEIVQNLKNFSRLDRAKVSEFSVEEGLESTLLLAKNLLKNKVIVEREFSHVPKIKCSPSQINQVFLNIITNAVHAMPEERSEQSVITLRTAMENKETIRVEIADNGSGIPADVLPKIFDPFFTTKEIGKGTGMGLSISFKIIQEHGGKILVNTEPGIGTVFSILLPVASMEETSVNSVLIDDEPVDEALLKAA
jgi:two-component system, NtrC family, sensor kinase